MCGIVGILGQAPVAPQMMEALRRLEYRGYDSAGLATLEDGQSELRRVDPQSGEVLEQLDMFGELVLPVLRAEFAKNRPEDVPETPTHASRLGASMARRSEEPLLPTLDAQAA